MQRKTSFLKQTNIRRHKSVIQQNSAWNIEILKYTQYSILLILIQTTQNIHLHPGKMGLDEHRLHYIPYCQVLTMDGTLYKCMRSKTD